MLASMGLHCCRPVRVLLSTPVHYNIKIKWCLCGLRLVYIHSFLLCKKTHTKKKTKTERGNYQVVIACKAVAFLCQVSQLCLFEIQTKWKELSSCFFTCFYLRINICINNSNICNVKLPKQQEALFEKKKWKQIWVGVKVKKDKNLNWINCSNVSIFNTWKQF